MKYAIIQTGGKQYRVSEGDVLDFELLGAGEGKGVEFKEVLLVSDDGNSRIGAPTLGDCVVKGELLDQVKGPKVIAYKFKRRQNYHRKKGHRQKYHRVKITAIQG